MFLTQAKRLLGWNPKHTITDDLAEYFEGYKAAGKVEVEPDFIQVRADGGSWLVFFAVLSTLVFAFSCGGDVGDVFEGQRMRLRSRVMKHALRRISPAFGLLVSRIHSAHPEGVKQSDAGAV